MRSTVHVCNMHSLFVQVLSYRCVSLSISISCLKVYIVLYFTSFKYVMSDISGWYAEGAQAADTESFYQKVFE